MKYGTKEYYLKRINCCLCRLSGCRNNLQHNRQIWKSLNDAKEKRFELFGADDRAINMYRGFVKDAEQGLENARRNLKWYRRKLEELRQKTEEYDRYCQALAGELSAMSEDSTEKTNADL